MRTPLLVLALCFLTSPLALRADQLKPRFDVDFGAGRRPTKVPRHFTFPFSGQEPKKQPAMPERLTLKHTEPSDSARPGFDCKMVKPVDPTFHSAMRIVGPPRHLTFRIKIIEAPPCRGGSR